MPVLFSNEVSTVRHQFQPSAVRCKVLTHSELQTCAGPEPGDMPGAGAMQDLPLFF